MKTPVWRRLLRLGLFAVVVSFLVLEAIPGPRLLDDVTFSPTYTDRSGHLLRLNLAGDDRYRLYVPLEKISPHLVEMTLAHEDRYFSDHPGFNPVALTRATWFAVSGHGPHIGASTLTMQLVRLHYGLNTRTVLGKLTQILAALHLELHGSKHDILEAYLNLAPYGRNIEGVGAASFIYFGKAANDVSDAEAITLAVLPQSPARRAPGRHKNDTALRQAREVLLTQWLEQHPEAAELRAVLAMPMQFHGIHDLPFLAPHLVDQLMSQAVQAKGETRLALDGAMQQVVEHQIHDYLEPRARLGFKNACAILVDYPSMEVRAAVGSANYHQREIQGQVNGLYMQRSPGSALKPFIYGLALDQGIIHPNSLLKDGPTSFRGYDPEDFDRNFLGPITAQEALTQSRNIPAVYLLSRLNPDQDLYQLLLNVGVRHLKPKVKYGLTLALGSAEVSPEDMAGLYATLANRGVWHPLRYRLDQAPVVGPTLLSPEASFLTLNMLQSAPRPDAVLAGGQAQEEAPIAWKTGTSFSFRDAWCAGVFDHYVLVVWVGNFDGKPNNGFVGRSAAAPLLFSLIDAIRAREMVPPASTCFTPSPDLNLRQVDLCTDSGCLAGPHCLHITKGWFIPGKSPIKTCEVHRQIWVDNRTGKRLAGFPTPGRAAHPIIAEFWPSDFAKLFAEAGFPRPTPPALEERASQASHTDHSPLGPHIVSPKSGLIYQVRLSRGSGELVRLEATAETSGENLHWFVDATYLGQTRASTPLLWTPQPGSHVVRAVDESGRADSRVVRVQTAE